MGLKIKGLSALRDISAFHEHFINMASKVDLQGYSPALHTVQAHIAEDSVCYSNGDRSVELGSAAMHAYITFKASGTPMYTTSLNEGFTKQLTASIHWLLNRPISFEQLAQEDIRVESPEDQKDYSTVELVVQVSSSYEVSQLYSEIKEKGWVYKQDMGGPLKLVGKIAKHECWVAPMIHEINGVRVLYIEPTGDLILWSMIEEWVKQRVPVGTPILTCPSRLLFEVRDIAERKKETV